MRISDWSSDVCSSDLILFNVIRKPEYWSALDNPFVFRKLGGFTLKALDGLKHIQDAWTLNRLRETRNARVLEIGGGVSRVLPARSEEHTSELQSLMRISYDVFFMKQLHQHNT